MGKQEPVCAGLAVESSALLQNSKWLFKTVLLESHDCSPGGAVGPC